MKEYELPSCVSQNNQEFIEFSRLRQKDQTEEQLHIREDSNLKRPLSKQQLSLRFDKLEKLCQNQLQLWSDSATLKESFRNMKYTIGRFFGNMQMPSVIAQCYLPPKARRERIQQRLGVRIPSFEQIFQQIMLVADQAQYSLKSYDASEEKQISNYLLIKNQKDVISFRLIAKIMKKGISLDKIQYIRKSFQQFISIKKRIDRQNHGS